VPGRYTYRNSETDLADDVPPRLRIIPHSLPAVLFVIALLWAFVPEATWAQKLPALATATSATPANSTTPAAPLATPAVLDACSAGTEMSRQGAPCGQPQPLIVIGFLGGRIGAGNMAHKEAVIAKDLDQQFPGAIDAMTFANHHERDALRAVVNLLDTSHDGHLSQAEKDAARIVIYGHSWGASETVYFARELARLGIPVLLTIQVDSIEKSGQDDSMIPANVREAINFYQPDGLLHGRSSIHAVDARRTTILGNYESAYKSKPVSCPGYSWYARAFMKPHIEIENDGAVWGRIETLIAEQSHLSLSRPSQPLPSQPRHFQSGSSLPSPSAVASAVAAGPEK
jgi:hypothetical protein